MCGLVAVPTLEVAPLLAMADGMVPLSTPRRIAWLWLLDSLVMAMDYILALLPGKLAGLRIGWRSNLAIN
jgi:hypothetical protein